MLAGNAAEADPICRLSPHHGIVESMRKDFGDRRTTDLSRREDQPPPDPLGRQFVTDRSLYFQSSFPAAQTPVNANRRRIRGARGRRLMRQRSERIERSFAHLYDTGGMHRTHLRGHTNILKRC